jgi:predicted DNA binding protein
MGQQHTRRDRSLRNGGSSVHETGSETTEGVWDADVFDAETDEEDGSSAADPAPNPTTESADASVSVDRGKLTDRQLEVLETAHGMGYYQYPRGANASEVAEALDICPSTLAEHLAAAQTKLLDDVLADRDAQAAD